MKSIKEIINTDQIKKHEMKQINIDWNSHAKMILNIAKTFESEYVINEHNKDVFKSLLLYFTGNSEFETVKKEYSLNKGIMLVGNTGTGKSLIFKIFKQYTMHILRVNSFQEHTSIDIIDNVNISGIEYLNKYSHNRDNNKAYPITCYIDDIASKNEKIKHYGTDLNVIEQLLSLRYNVYEKYGKLTHTSSNFYPTQLKEIYEDRIISRMSEMFNVIELKGSDYRRIF